MQSPSKQLNPLFQQQQQIHQAVKKTLCPNNQPAIYICFNKKCNNYAFICQNKSCKCRENHKFCMKHQIQDLINYLFSKSQSLEPVYNSIEGIFEKVIDSLSEMRDKVLGELRGKGQWQGLTQKESQLLNAIKTNKVSQINCNFIWQISSKMYEQQKIKTVKQVQQDVSKLWDKLLYQTKSLQKSLIKYFQNLNNNYNQNTSNTSKNFSNSKIIKKIQEEETLIYFFNKQIKYVELLYRASQNQFSAKKFHEKCDNAEHTLVICENIYGKVFGGYTPLKWNQAADGEYAQDPQKRSFMFSVSNREKFKLQKNDQFQICCYGNSSGPVFGGGHDLYISDKADKNTNSYANIGYCYTNSDYIFSDPQAQKKFSQAYKFQVKQWQVWRVEFSQQLKQKWQLM